MSATQQAAAQPLPYPCSVIDVDDGDTVQVLADRGGGDWWLIEVRLADGNARELGEPGGLAARGHLRALLAPITPSTVAALFSTRSVRGTLQVLGPDKYGGRQLGRLVVPGVGFVMEKMIADGYAARWDGRGAKPVPPWPNPADLASADKAG